MIGVELCSGTLCVGLSALAGRLVDPITGFMGSKRRWRERLARAAFGLGEIDHLIAVDSGPWGDVWQTFGPLGLRADVEKLLRLEARKGLLPERWPVLVEREPPEDPAERAAQYLMLQARSASARPAAAAATSTRSRPVDLLRCAGTGRVDTKRRARCVGIDTRCD